MFIYLNTPLTSRSVHHNIIVSPAWLLYSSDKVTCLGGLAKAYYMCDNKVLLYSIDYAFCDIELGTEQKSKSCYHYYLFHDEARIDFTRIMTFRLKIKLWVTISSPTHPPSIKVSFSGFSADEFDGFLKESCSSNYWKICKECFVWSFEPTHEY